jgi:hypothetical protein
MEKECAFQFKQFNNWGLQEIPAARVSAMLPEQPKDTCS